MTHLPVLHLLLIWLCDPEFPPPHSCSDVTPALQQRKSVCISVNICASLRVGLIAETREKGNRLCKLLPLPKKVHIIRTKVKLGTGNWSCSQAMNDKIDTQSSIGRYTCYHTWTFYHTFLRGKFRIQLFLKLFLQEMSNS